MIDIGLYPSSTAAPGGSETGDRVSHYIIEDGLFDITCGEFLTDGFALTWLENALSTMSLIPPTSKAVKGGNDGSNRWKYTCPVCVCVCGFNAWAKPKGLLVCGVCTLLMTHNTQK